MSDVPSNLIPTRITGLPEYLGTSTLGYLPYVIDGNTYKVQFANIAAVGAVPSTRQINTGSGLGGGGDLSANRTLFILPGGVDDSRLTTTGVTAGTYGAADSVPVLTINAQGRVTAATLAPIVLSNYVPTSRTITAGAGLTGGGDLSANRTFAVNFSSTTPEPLGPGSSGVSTVAAREDHVHPAVDLSDTTETQGVLPLSRGGTGNSLSPVVGAVAYSSNDALYLTPTSGNAGDVLVSGGGVSPPFWQAPIGGGTVTSVAASGGTTGLTFTGSPITTSGTLTLGGTLAVANGGTGATNAATALTNLGAYPASNPAGYTSNVGTVTSVSGTGTVSGLSLSGTVTSAGSLTLGGTLAVTPSDFASQSANTVLAAPNGSAGVPTFRAIVAADIPTLNQNTTGTAGNVSGIVAVANGGTGASVAGTARTNLGAAASGANTDITSIALTTGTVSATPTNGTDIVNKMYADSIASGINFHQSVRLATAAALPANTYNNGSSGVGATLTANANGALTVDGVAAVVGNRILVKNEVAQANNGVYTVTQVGDGSTPYILTRATDFDSAGTGVDQIDAGDFFLVTAGSTQSNTSWVQQTPLPITVGTTALVFTQFAAPVLYSAGTGLTLAGTVFSITNTGVSASTYGSASSVPVLAINAQGQVTSASNSSIAINASQITSGTVTVAQGGTGATTLGANGVLLGNGTSAISATAVGATGQVLVGNTGAAPTWSTLSGIGVTSFSAGTTGLTPASATTGAITLAGTLGVANGGTGATTLSSGYLVKGNGTSAASASVVYDDGTNVGIGTTAPTTKLDVRGVIASIGASGTNAVVIGDYGATAGTFAIKAVTGRNFTITDDYAGAERMRIDSSGNVGIGTSTPARTLSVYSASSIPAQIESSGTDARISIFTSSGSGGQGFVQASSGALLLGSSNTERMRIDSSGNVGIGTSSPAYKLTVSGDIGGASSLFLGANLNNANSVEIGNGRTGNNFAYIDLIGDTTYTDYGTRLLRGNSGANSQSILAHRGTGELVIRTEDAAVISFATTNTERMRIDSSGNVGIGTSSPTSRLTITGGTTEIRDGNYLMLRPSGNGWDMRLQATSTQLDILSGGALGSPIMSLVNGGNVGIGTSSPGAKLDTKGLVRSSIGTGTGAGGAGYAFYQFGTSATATENWHIGAEGDGSFRFYNQGFGAGLERMRITSAGNVGIGTSSPNYKLETNGIIASYVPGVGQAGYWLYNGGATAEWFTGQRSGTDHAYKISTVVAGTYTDRVTVDTSGNVGIGTSPSGDRLNVAGTAQFTNATYCFAGVTSGSVQGQFAANAGGTVELRAVTNHPLAMFTNNTERARITNSGFLLVGTTAPLGGNTSSEFKVTGAGSWPLTLNANDRGLLVRNSAAGSGFYAYFEYNGGTNNGSISWSGGTTSYTTTSDARIKKNIVDAPDAGALIDAIQVRSWDFKADDVHWRYGMVAQELLPVAPEAVTVPEDEEIMMGVDYAKLVPMLIKEVQSLRARVAQLEGN